MLGGSLREKRRVQWGRQQREIPNEGIRGKTNRTNLWPKAALTYFNRAIPLNLYPPPYISRAVAEIALEPYHDAILDLSQAERLDPKKPGWARNITLGRSGSEWGSRRC
jgi:hypothetical protein